MHLRSRFSLWFLSLLVLGGPLWAQDDFLPPEQAFPVSARADGPASLVVSWAVQDGYYLYRNKLKFQSETQGITLGTPEIPEGEIRKDPFFGAVAILRGQVAVRLPIVRTPEADRVLILETTAQGCADAGLCYPPLHQRVHLELPPVPVRTPPPTRGSETSLADLLDPPDPSLGSLGFDDGLLPAEEAYRFTAEVLDPNSLHLHWDIAEGTYLYRENLQLALKGAEGVHLGDYALPPAEVKTDTVRPDGEIGTVAVYHGEIDLEVPLVRTDPGPTTLTLVAKYQGCSETYGVCYPPQTAEVPLALPAATRVQADAGPAPDPRAPATVREESRAPTPDRTEDALSEQDRIAATLARSGFWTAMGLFFGFGLLLAFTPCVFPMIPILSGIIAGQGANLTSAKAFWMSLIYVLAMALTYALVGLLAGLGGANLQVDFQSPWIIVPFALVFVALALSMFGFYELQVPSALQSRLSTLSHRQQGGTLLGVGIMGVLSALIVGPCVAPPLAGALLFIGQTGDGVLGFSALFALGLGMGAPLLLVGTSAGRFLPKAGIWMDAIKAAFGVGLLAVALVLLERILPPAIALVLWGMLFIISATYLGATQPLDRDASGWRKLWKGLGLVLLVYGILMLVGAASGSRDTVQPLRGLGFFSGGGNPMTQAHARFQRIKTIDDLDRALAAARQAGKPVLLDFYADWCVSCKEMERETFSDPRVIAEMDRFIRLQADVTANDAEDQALLQGRFGLPGPPAILFFDAQGRELRNRRLVGFLGPEAFATHLRAIRP